MSDFQLKVYPGTPEEETIELEPGSRLKIGRRPEHNVNKFIITDPNISGTHCEIWHDGFHWRIEDKDSTNGTTINGRACLSGQEYVLRHDDLIQIAHIPIRCYYSSQEETFRLEPVAEKPAGEKLDDQFKAHVKLQPMPVQELPDFVDDESRREDES